jgi:hypothetical protein
VSFVAKVNTESEALQELLAVRLYVSAQCQIHLSGRPRRSRSGGESTAFGLKREGDCLVAGPRDESAAHSALTLTTNCSRGSGALWFV